MNLTLPKTNPTRGPRLHLHYGRGPTIGVSKRSLPPSHPSRDQKAPNRHSPSSPPRRRVESKESISPSSRLCATNATGTITSPQLRVVHQQHQAATALIRSGRAAGTQAVVCAPAGRTVCDGPEGSMIGQWVGGGRRGARRRGEARWGDTRSTVTERDSCRGCVPYWGVLDPGWEKGCARALRWGVR